MKSSSIPAPVVYFFVFQNILTPVSPYITISLNVLLAGLFIFRANLVLLIPDRFTVFFVIGVFIWFLLVATFRGGFEDQVFLKYLRTTLAVITAGVFLGAARIEAGTFLGAVSFTLGFHVFLLLLQVPTDDVVKITAPIFGFERELWILDDYRLRKLGATSSYDTASFLSVSSAVLCYLRYQSERKILQLALLVLSLGAGLLSSRLGMVMTAALIIFICVRAILKEKALTKLATAVSLLVFIVFGYSSIYPLVLHSLGLADLGSDQGSLIYAATDYGTTGTLEALTVDHLAPLKVAPMDLVIGFAVDPNSIGLPSDIGYVKFIYHVGIVGTFLILLVHWRMLGRTVSALRRRGWTPAARVLAYFLIWLVVAGVVFNYKALQIYSRGIGDFTILLFLFLCTWQRRRARQLRGGWVFPEKLDAETGPARQGA
jgi:hypothetical protein